MMSVIIPLASQNIWPQSLAMVNNKQTLIEYQIFKIKQLYPSAEIIVVVGQEADKIIKKIPRDIKIVENELFGETGTLRTIAVGLRICSFDNVLIINGDIVFEESEVTNFADKSSIVVHQNINNIEVGVNIMNGKVASFAFGVSPKWSKILYLGPRELEKFKKIAFDRGKRKWYTYEACNVLIDQGGIIYTKINKKNKAINYDCII